MKKYLIDTNIISYLVDTDSPFHKNVKRHFESLQENDNIALSILNIYELNYGLAQATESNDSRVSRMRKDLCARLRFPIVYLTENGAEIFGNLKTKYQKEYHLPKTALSRDTIDLMIASSAIAEGYTLVSNDKIFQNLQLIMSEFQTENWAA